MKTIVYPVEVKVEVRSTGELLTSAHYGIEADGIGIRKGVPVVLSDAEFETISSLINTVLLPKIKTAEGIA